MPFGDEYYSNPINTQNKCEHGIPMKHRCETCFIRFTSDNHDHLIKHAQIGIEKCFERIEALERNLKALEMTLSRITDAICN